MKKYLLSSIIIFISILFTACKNEIKLEYYDNGQIKTKAQYNSKNEKNGLFFKYSKTGDIIEVGEFKNNFKNGEFKYFTLLGDLKKIEHYKNNLKDGIFEEYFNSNKLLKKFNYKNDLKEGEQIVYFQNGSISSIENYRNGKLFSDSKKFTEDNILIYHILYADEEQKVFEKHWYEDGTPKYEYKLEITHTEEINYFPNGQIERIDHKDIDSNNYIFVQEYKQDEELYFLYKEETLNLLTKVSTLKYFYPNGTIKSQTIKKDRHLNYGDNFQAFEDGTIYEQFIYDEKHQLKYELIRNKDTKEIEVEKEYN